MGVASQHDRDDPQAQREVGARNAAGPGFDSLNEDIQLPVPEPRAIGLAMAALASLGILGRRRRRRL